MKHVENKFGFTLLETAIAGGLMVGMVLAVTSSMLYQYGQNRAIQQKIESLELEQELNRSLLDANNCDCMFVSGQSTGINLAQGVAVAGLRLNQGCTGNPWILPNSKLQGSISGLQIEDIKISDISQAGVGTYTANLVISLNTGGAGGSLRPISIPQTFNTNTTGNIVGCSGVRQITEDKIDKFCTSIPNATIDLTTGKCMLPSIGSNQVGLYPPGSHCGPNSTGLVVYSGSTPQCVEVLNGALAATPL